MAQQVSMGLVAEFDESLYPDAKHLHGGGFGGKAYSDEELALYRKIVAATLPDEQRRRVKVRNFDPNTIPLGFTTLVGENNEPFSDIRAGLEKQATRRGWLLDSIGRPLHPFANILMEDAFIGMPVGLGGNLHYGERVVVKLAVHHENRLALVRSVDGSRRAKRAQLPTAEMTRDDLCVTHAGWMSGNRDVEVEVLFAMAERICREQLRLDLADNYEVCVLRAVRPVLSTTTLHSWELVFLLEVVEAPVATTAKVTLAPLRRPADYKASLSLFDRWLLGALTLE